MKKNVDFSLCMRLKGWAYYQAMEIEGNVEETQTEKIVVIKNDISNRP